MIPSAGSQMSFAYFDIILMLFFLLTFKVCVSEGGGVITMNIFE